jgi:2-amino-4-hydroxy-6-hydroxymethyldihydropteridine diphosphokinase
MRVVVGMGANLGDRLGTMREAMRRIAERARIEAVSRVYETDPVGGPEQPAFLNAAIAIAWERDPLALLDVLQEIEHDLGRTRELRWGPRTIDLDVLWLEGGAQVDHPRLVVPHPRLHERAFASRPLLEVAPEANFASAATEDPGVRPTNFSLS